MSKTILIGGSPFSGKSTLARELAAKFKYACISTDDIGEAVRAISSDQTLNPMNGIAHKDYYLKYSFNELIEHTKLQHSTMEKPINAVIGSHSNWASPIVIEGWALYPESITKLPYSNIDSLWLIASPDILLKRIQANSQFCAGCNNPDEMIRKYLERSLWHNNLLKESANRFGMNTLCIDSNPSIEDMVTSACKLFKQSHERMQ